MIRKLISVITVIALVAAVCCAFAESSDPVSVQLEESPRPFRIGNTTEMQGKFFTEMWGCSTSDIDVQRLLHGYPLTYYSIDKTQYEFDSNVVSGHAVTYDKAGNKTYQIVLCDDLFFSDGTPVTAYDYAFSFLFSIDPVIAETGGHPMDGSWIKGIDEYLNKESDCLEGIRIINDRILRITAKADSLPYFYELSRLEVNPYPVQVIAPGIEVKDDGKGVYLADAIPADTVNTTVLDPENGYLSHPSVVTGAYKLESFDGKTARFAINEYYKGNREGRLPSIEVIEYTSTKNDDMLRLLNNGTYDLLNKVTMKESIEQGFAYVHMPNGRVTSAGYPRTGLSMLWFAENSPKVQDLAVRKAIAYCFDRDAFIEAYTNGCGKRVDGMYGIGQWMFLLATHKINAPVSKSLPAEEYQNEIEYYQNVSLDRLHIYKFDVYQGAYELNKSGWGRNKSDVRFKEAADGTEITLNLVIGVPDSTEAREYLDEYLMKNLEKIGIKTTLKIMSMEELQKAYNGEISGVDLLYLGEDFHELLNVNMFKPVEETNETQTEKNSLVFVKDEIYELARDMVKTKPGDIKSFITKWVVMQEKISETLPLIPVYSNEYYDFYTKELHDYQITEYATWAEAVVKSYISDIEE